MSDKLVSLMMSQLSENRNLDQVFWVLFSSQDSEIYKYADDKTRGYGVNVNPKKSEQHSFAENDQIVVLAQN